MTASERMEQARVEFVHTAVDTAVLRPMAMTDVDRAAVARKFNAQMEMALRDARLPWAKTGA